jgi:hypothetical protein
MAKSKTKAEEALQFLDDLDNLNASATAPPSSSGSSKNLSAKGGGVPVTVKSNTDPNANNAGDPGDVLKFIDEITLKSSEPTAPLERPSSRASLATPQGTMRRATERVRVGSPAPPSVPAPGSAGSASTTGKAEGSASATPGDTKTEAGEGEQQATSGWGWGSVWSSASAAIQQARTAVDEGRKHLPMPTNEQAMKWREGVLSRVPFDKEQLEKLGEWAFFVILVYDRLLYAFP